MNIYKLNSDEGRNFLKKISSRQLDMEDEVIDTVREIMKTVRQDGDKALFNYAKAFDKVELTSLEVTKSELDEAESRIGQDIKQAIDKAYENIWDFQFAQKPQDFEYEKQGIIAKTRYIPIENAGIYVPGGKASYPSSVLMNAIPARAAGVKQIIMTVPCNQEGKLSDEILYAAKICKVDRIFKIGGAQAIAGMAYGTETVPKVDIITGPGNIYVSLAKKLVYGAVNIDMIAGPSEILILADGNQNADFIGADLISQAEHDELASSILLTLSSEEAEKVSKKADEQLTKLPKTDIATKSLQNYGGILICENIQEMIDTANLIAPEHLEIMFNDNKLEDTNYEDKNDKDNKDKDINYEDNQVARQIANQIVNAGCIFVGRYSPEPLGDYMAGPKHILPTNGSARSFSPLGTQTFMKRSNYLEASKGALENIYKDIVCFAQAEGLQGHANSILRRFEDETTND